MGDTSTLTLKKGTVEMVGQVKRKLAFEEDKDFTNDEVIQKMCKDALAQEMGLADPEEETPD